MASTVRSAKLKHRGMDRIGGVEKLEKFDEFATAVAILDEGVSLAGQQINPGQPQSADIT
jgi:hypothetical protein